MKSENYFYKCSQDYLNTIDLSLYNEIVAVISILPKRQTQAEINYDLFWLLTAKGWSFDTFPSSLPNTPPAGLGIGNTALSEIRNKNNRDLCRTSTTINATWHSDFAKGYDKGLVQIEAQFGKVESMFKDFCGFKIANHEKRLALGIEIVLSQPNSYFIHRKSAISGMAYFDIAKTTLPSIDLDCPIWLIGITE
jgi:hypothetical protein